MPTRGDVCGTDNCTSRKYHIVDGQWYCSNGHLKEGFIEMGQDEDDYAYAGRNITRQRRDQDRKGITTTTTTVRNEHKYMGHRGYTLYLQGIQILLRHQVEYLINVQKCPRELESRVKKLWIRYIESSKIGLHFLGNSHDDEEEGEQEDTPIDSLSDDDEYFSDEASSYREEEDVHQDSITKTLTERRRKQARKTVIYKKVPIIFLIGLCYIGCRQLNIPIYISDMQLWIENYKMPYMNGLKYIPNEMRLHLMHEYCVMMQPRSLPIQSAIHAAVQKLCDMLSLNYKLLPSTLLLRQIALLSLPLQVYPAVLKLSTVLNIDYTCGGSMSKRKIAPKYWPEVQLMAVLVIVTTLYIDETALPQEQEQESTPDELLNKEVIEWSNDEIDLYMDWFQETWTTTTADESMSKRRLLSMFPLESTNTSSGTTTTTTRNKWKDILNNDIIINKSKQLDIYKPFAQLPTRLQGLIKSVSKISTVSVSDLKKCIRQVEIECKKKNAIC